MTRALPFASRIAAISMILLPWAGIGPVLAQDSAEAGADEQATEDQEPRATFDVALDAQGAGGRIRGSAGDYQFQPGRILVASQGVELKYGDLSVEADTIRLDIPADRLTAEGNVILDQGPERLSGDVLEYDLKTKTGRMTNALAAVQPGFYFSGTEIEKVGPMTFTVENGMFTSCEGEDPSWSLAMSRADITMEEYARIRNARLRFGKVPVFYTPYILWPATTERTSGWLVPKPGYSDRRGAHVSLAYYKTLGRSADTTFFLDLSTNEFNGAGWEYRYRPSEDTKGVFDLYYTTEPDDAFLTDSNRELLDPERVLGDDRWKLLWQHETKNVWDRFRGVVNLQLYSDFDYLRDIERSVDRQTQSFIYSNAFLSSNVGAHSLNFMVDRRELVGEGTITDDTGATVNTSNRTTLHQLPELEWRMRSTRLGSLPLYLSLTSSVNYFQADFDRYEQNLDTEKPALLASQSLQYGRADFSPTLSIPISTLPWLSAKLSVGARYTYYTKTLDDPDNPDHALNDDPLDGDAVDRFLPSGKLEIVGPSFSRVFEKDGGKYSKFKHIIEPRFTYTYVDDFEERFQLSRFDEVDLINPLNQGVISIVNRLLAKPRDEEEGGAFEIASLAISQAHIVDDFIEGNDDTEQSEGPIFSTLRVNPNENTSFKFELRYDTEASAITSRNFSGNTKIADRFGFGLSWFTQWATDADGMGGLMRDRETSNQIRFSTNLELVPEKVIFGAQINYNLIDPLPLNRRRLLAQRYVLKWVSDCYDWNLEFREHQYRDADSKDSEIRFSLSLKNVGTFLDLNESLN